ncbi:MAG: hypothetical protein WC238_01735 [Parcubacteria group bacterium]|jgi:hypothetical protein
MKKLDWKQLGQFFSVLLSVFAIIRGTFKKMGIGIEIISWIVTEEGKKYFSEKVLEPLGKEYLTTQRVRFLSETVIEVNLDIAPRLPFDGAKVETYTGGGWVKVEKRKDGLYVGGHKVILYLSERQKDGKVIKGYELKEEITGKWVLNANILDALLENLHLIPEEWKKDGNGNTIFIFFWGTIFRGPSDGSLIVRCLCFGVGQWYSSHFWLDYGFLSVWPAALLAS